MTCRSKSCTKTEVAKVNAEIVLLEQMLVCVVAGAMDEKLGCDAIVLIHILTVSFIRRSCLRPMSTALPCDYGLANSQAEVSGVSMTDWCDCARLSPYVKLSAGDMTGKVDGVDGGGIGRRILPSRRNWVDWRNAHLHWVYK